jgi:hypothetical protein
MWFFGNPALRRGFFIGAINFECINELDQEVGIWAFLQSEKAAI